MKKKKILGEIVDDRDIFVRIDPMDSLESKKDLLEINEALIEAQIAAEKFKQQRREEMKARIEAKKLVKEMALSLGHMLSELPKEIKIKIKKEHHEAPVKIIKKTEAVKAIKKVEEIKPTKMSDLQSELNDIKSRLSGLK